MTKEARRDESADGGAGVAGSDAVLALECSTAFGSAAVGNEAGVLAEIVANVAARHSSGLLPAVDAVLESAGLEARDVAAVVVGEGPGSFTGLRIAAATAKGIVAALGVPLFAYSGLLAAAAAAWASDAPVCALFDARRGDVFAACYRFAHAEIDGAPAPGAEPIEIVLAPTVLAVDDLIDRFRAAPPVFVGEGATLHAQHLTARLGARIVPPHLAAPRASALVWLATHAPRLGLVPDAAAWEPRYIRASGAERIAAARAASPPAGG